MSLLPHSTATRIFPPTGRKFPSSLLFRSPILSLLIPYARNYHCYEREEERRKGRGKSPLPNGVSDVLQPGKLQQEMNHNANSGSKSKPTTQPPILVPAPHLGKLAGFGAPQVFSIGGGLPHGLLLLFPVVYHVPGDNTNSRDKSCTLNGTTVFTAARLWCGNNNHKDNLNETASVLSTPSPTITAIVELPPYIDNDTTSGLATQVHQH